MRPRHYIACLGILLALVVLMLLVQSRKQATEKHAPWFNMPLHGGATKSPGNLHRYVNLTSPHTKEEIHICVAAGKAGIIKELSVLLKSMFIHASNNNIFLHFLVDKDSENEIVPFMSAYTSVNVNVRYETLILQEDFVRNETSKFKAAINHHSGVFGMSKLFFFKLWKDVEKCMVLDTDLIFARDPAWLWEEFSKMDNQSLILMKLDERPELCNSGVMLQKFQVMRERNFEQFYSRGVTKYCTPIKGKSDLYDCGGHGDQNIFHQVFLQFPQFFKQISSSWNLEYCHDFFNYDFGVSAQKKSDLFFGIAHFNCLQGDNYISEFKSQRGKHSDLALYIEKVNQLNSKDLLGSGTVQRVTV